MRQHGTYTCYLGGCRRAECREAWRVWHQAWRRRRGVQAKKYGRAHGTRSCYVMGCRRPECVEANRVYINAWRKRRAS